MSLIIVAVAANPAIGSCDAGSDEGRSSEPNELCHARAQFATAFREPAMARIAVGTRVVVPSGFMDRLSGTSVGSGCGRAKDRRCCLSDA